MGGSSGIVRLNWSPYSCLDRSTFNYFISLAYTRHIDLAMLALMSVLFLPNRFVIALAAALVFSVQAPVDGAAAFHSLGKGYAPYPQVFRLSQNGSVVIGGFLG